MTGVERLVVRILADATNYNRVFTTAETRLMTFVSIASAASISLGRSMAKMASDWQDVGVAFKVMMGDAEKSTSFLRDIEQFAIATPFNIQEVAKGAQLMHAYGVEVDNLLPALKAMGNIVAGTGGDVDILNRVMYNFGQVVSQNRATAVDIRQFAMAGIGVKNFADTLGVSTAEFAKMVEAGEVGADTVIRTFNRMSGEGGKFYELMQQRNQMARGQFKSLREELEISFRNIGIDMLEGMKDSGLLTYLRDLAKNFSLSSPEMRAGFQEFFSDIKAGLETMKVLFREVGDALKDWRDMLKQGGSDIDALSGKQNTFNEIVSRIPKIFGDLFRALRIVFFTLLSGLTQIITVLFRGVDWVIRQASKVSDFLGLGTFEGFKPDNLQVGDILGEEFLNQAFKDINAIDFGAGPAARFRAELERGQKAAGGTRDILRDIGQIRPPWMPLPPDMMKFIEETKSAFKKEGGLDDFMKKTAALSTAFWTVNPETPGLGFIGKEAFGFGMMQQLQNLEKFTDTLERKLPPSAFKDSAEAQDIINKNQEKQVSIQERILQAVEAAKDHQEATAKAAWDIARAIENMKDKGLIQKKMP